MFQEVSVVGEGSSLPPLPNSSVGDYCQIGQSDDRCNYPGNDECHVTPKDEDYRPLVRPPAGVGSKVGHSTAASSEESRDPIAALRG